MRDCPGPGFTGPLHSHRALRADLSNAAEGGREGGGGRTCLPGRRACGQRLRGRDVWEVPPPGAHSPVLVPTLSQHVLLPSSLLVPINSLFCGLPGPQLLPLLTSNLPEHPGEGNPFLKAYCGRVRVCMNHTEADRGAHSHFSGP